MKRFLWLCIILMLSVCSALAAETDLQPLRYGDTGDQVLELQTRLKDLLYYNGPLSGEFGQLTRNAVQRVQMSYGLEVTGIADEQTQNIIYGDCYRELKYEMSGRDVEDLQKALTLYGYYTDRVSGNYLKNTRAAVSAFQGDNGLDPTGIADVKMQELLYSGTVPLPTPTPEPTPAPTPSPTPTPAPTAVPDLSFQGTLRNGDTGKRVKLLQERLASLGFYEGDITTGYYARTTAAVKAFQRHNGLKVDGITGQETWNAVFGQQAVPASATAVPPTPVPYALEVDVVNQVTKVYARDENGEFTVLYKAFICSTGTAGFPSDVGTFILTGRKAPWAQFPKWGGGTARYWTQINPNIAFHSVIYEDYDTEKLKVSSFNALGRPASHGCIRLTVPDARWIYNNCGEGTQVRIYDDAAKDPELTAAVKPGSLNPDTKLNYITPTPTVMPVYDSHNPPETIRKLSLDSRGEDVYWLQMRLKELGYYTGTVTGRYKAGTEKAVRAYQKDNGLSGDGVAGSQTLKKLYNDARQKALVTPSPAEMPLPSGTPLPLPESTPSAE